MQLFSANLGFLWNDIPLAEAIRKAKAAGFHAVECHWPYDQPIEEVKAAMTETGLPMLGINTMRGDVAAGEMGLAAVPGREGEARAAIDQALTYANAIGAAAVHVMAGNSSGPEAKAKFVENLKYAADRAAETGTMILIEPLNRNDAPGYFLQTTDQARDIIEQVGAGMVRLMFDCYHVGRNEGDVVTRLKHHLPIIGHIQFASIPDRVEPDFGELDYAYVFAAIADLGWVRPLGAEYKPSGPVEDTLGWFDKFGGAV